MKKVISAVVISSMMVASIPAGWAASKPKYAKTEADKAIGKCVAAVIGGALLGGLAAGKKNRGTGVLVGAAAGGAVCAVLMANAKRKDRILAAQRETAMRNENYATSFQDDDGNPMQYRGMVSSTAEIDGGQLVPVKYTPLGGGSAVSPQLGTGGHECRFVDSAIGSAQGAAGIPSQAFCRTDSGDWEPYQRSI